MRCRERSGPLHAARCAHQTIPIGMAKGVCTRLVVTSWEVRRDDLKHVFSRVPGAARLPGVGQREELLRGVEHGGQFVRTLTWAPCPIADSPPPQPARASTAVTEETERRSLMSCMSGRCLSGRCSRRLEARRPENLHRLWRSAEVVGAQCAAWNPHRAALADLGAGPSVYMRAQRPSGHLRAVPLEEASPYPMIP